jgi:HME family heavy-metal exporter
MAATSDEAARSTFFPDLNRPTVTIFSEAGGSRRGSRGARHLPDRVGHERRRERAAGALRLLGGLSIVFVEFGFNQDIYIARQIVTERLQQVSEQLPPTIKPVLTPITSIMGEIMLVGVTSDNPDVTPMDLRRSRIGRFVSACLSVPGISQIAVIGGELKQYQVLVDPFKLRNFNISLHDVEEATKNANVNSTAGSSCASTRSSSCAISRVSAISRI